MIDYHVANAIPIGDAVDSDLQAVCDKLIQSGTTLEPGGKYFKSFSGFNILNLSQDQYNLTILTQEKMVKVAWKKQ